MLRVAIVDDHPVARYGVVKFIEELPDLTLAGAAAHPGDLPRTPDGVLDFDVLVLDLYLNGDEPSIQQIAALSGGAPILVMSASRDPADVLAAIQAGAAGYLTKQAGPDAFATAVRAVASGEFYLSPQLADLIEAAAETRPQPPDRPTLSQREQETLSYIARGFTHQQTATRMGVATATVNTYVARIRSKLQVGNKAELALASMRYLQWRRSRTTRL